MRAHRNFSRAGPRGYRNTASAETQRGCQWAKPPETESFEAFAHLKGAEDSSRWLPAFPGETWANAPFTMPMGAHDNH